MHSWHKYFQRHASTDSNSLEYFPASNYRHVICIPAHDEDPRFVFSLAQAAACSGKPCLLILIINQPQHSPHCDNNHKLYHQLQQHPELWRNNPLSLHRFSARLDILLIDYFHQQRIPADKGVGLARKIAADIACYLIMQKHIHSQQFFCSDADVIFPDDYFSAAVSTGHSAAVLAFDHIHCGDAAIDQATAIYQQSLHDYVAALAEAGSPYAFHTIGSCLLIDADCYIKVHGFPQRNGAEDFYLLNKLQKVRPVASLASPRIAIRSRDSARVPFGTGPAVRKLLDQPDAYAALFYPPHCFVFLANWLQWLDTLALDGHWQDTPNMRLMQLAEHFQLNKALTRIFANHSRALQRSQQLHNWFDGFKTLKLLRLCRAWQAP